MSNASTPLEPLKGLVVLDLSRHLPGPLLTRCLTDLGARVVKLEAPSGDPARHMAAGPDGTSPLFNALNAGKESLCLDLKAKGGADVLKALAAKADIVVESFRPGVMKRLGVDYDTLSAVNPRLIMCSISAFGQDNPRQDRPGHDINFNARAGALSLMGPAGEVPATPGVQLGDVAGGGLFSAMGILAALLERNATGRGRHLDVSMTRGSLVFAHYGYLANGGSLYQTPRGGGPLSGGAPCYGIYETKDGRFVSIGALEPKFFVSFCNVAGCPDLGAQGLMMGPAAEPVQAKLIEVFKGRTLEEWTQLLDEVDCCVEPVLTVDEALKDEAVDATVAQVGGVSVLLTDLGARPVVPDSLAVSDLGADARTVFTDLGISEELLRQAAESGAIPS